jgi:hypothetical protein
VYEYNLSEASENDWERFSAMLESASKDFEEETKNEDADYKLAKLYEHVERATHIVFNKKEAFEEKENAEKGDEKGDNQVKV